MTPYAQLLGPGLQDLPPACRAIHARFGRHEGRISVEPARSPVLRLAARLAGLPRGVQDASLIFETIPEGDGALWIRKIGPYVMTSRQRAMADGTLAETLGPVTLAARLVRDGAGLHLETAWVRLLGLPLPRLLWPRMTATEWQEGGLYRFEIALFAPLLGAGVIAYSGWLDSLAPAVDGGDRAGTGSRVDLQ